MSMLDASLRKTWDSLRARKQVEGNLSRQFRPVVPLAKAEGAFVRGETRVRASPLRGRGLHMPTTRPLHVEGGSPPTSERGTPGTTETCAEPRLGVGAGHREEWRESMTDWHDRSTARVLRGEDTHHHGMA